MASSSVGSNVFAGLAILVISLLVLLLLRYYLPLRSTPAYLLLPVFLALVLPVSIIILVPIDLASTSSSDHDTSGGRGIWLPEPVILVTWRIAYWLTFLLTWFILPLLGEYSDSGYREPKDRLIYSLRSNARYQAIVLASAILGGVYFVITSGFKTQSVKGLVMALAYAWGLVMAIYLMGHGLVALPRRLFRNASTENRLRRTEAFACKVHDKLEEAEEELGTIEAQATMLQNKRTGLKADLKDWIDELVEISVDARQPAYARSARPSLPAVITERYMEELTRKLKRARHKHARFADEWKRLVDTAVHLQRVIDSAASQRLEAKQTPGGKGLSILTPYTRYLLYARVIPAVRLAGAALLALASVILVWSEVSHTFTSSLSVVGLTVVHHPDSAKGQVGFAGQAIAALWLFYMCAAALYSMSEVKVWGNRALVKRQTYGESACWYSLQVAKLTVPLSYNFITMLPPTVYKETAFYAFLGKLINLTPLGSGFSQYFPLFILLPVCAALFNLYGKVKNLVGLGVLDDDSEEGAGTSDWREGRALIQRDVRDQSTSVGLAQANGGFRDRPSLDQQPGDNPGRAPLLIPVGGERTSATTRPPAPRESENDDDGPRYFFQDFGERVRNTFESAERPQWVQDIGDAFNKPKWMNNENGGSGDRSVFSRMFGGHSSSNDGRMRL